MLLEMASLKRQGETPLKLLKADQVEAFGKALRAKLAENGPSPSNTCGCSWA